MANTCRSSVIVLQPSLTLKMLQNRKIALRRSSWKLQGSRKLLVEGEDCETTTLSPEYPATSSRHLRLSPPFPCTFHSLECAPHLCHTHWATVSFISKTSDSKSLKHVVASSGDKARNETFATLLKIFVASLRCAVKEKIRWRYC